ncbi:MAG: ATP-dependent DNA helicase [Marinobacter sp.]|uniref:ATP-dependent DNA helicase n=1 Tax=Marinobacter sp. TaxID=50741 RepID=UPI0029C1D06B|nr:ATP-dependent DNA helicase [Marinobacter sp.]MDX5336646.1 ATP-dependent DNA helicase [Marinobacter sp.]MDX5387795.1 ATP-dependent DNA helicase [Marinobacter sp.]MDX5440517.1 ATP-dependent DNA helicase [Alteromonadaceae bacterium]MDX5473095.1 ATP-dependent DNA helicase [Marinobacter sp.]
MKVAVRTLCEFAARHGDLDFRYTPAPSSEEGIAGHQAIQAKRGYGYKSEYSLTGKVLGMKLSGRADGYHPHKNRLEEIKTHRGDVSRIRPHQRALHRAQLRAYGALLCRQENCKNVELALVYYDTGRDKETVLTETATAGELWQELETLCGRYQAWAEQEEHHREQRDALLANLRFPFPDFRPRQRQLAETVYKNSVKAGTLLLEAPTGLGKTLGTLFPALMAMPAARQDRLFYLTCRNTARQLALDAVDKLRQAQNELQPWPLRTLELVSKDDACEHPDKACHGESCPLAKGFFDRLPDARAEAVQSKEPLNQEILARIAAGYDICPYFLAQEMARWSDLVIGDVNRMFDQSALLHGLIRQNNWQASVLVDEAHNLVDRARGMYSVQLEQQRLLKLKKIAPKPVKAALDRTARAWQALIRDHGEQAQPVFLATLPPQLLGALQAMVSVITDYLADNPPDLALQEVMFESVAFMKLADSFGDHSLCEFQRTGRGRASLTLQNLIPADFLTERFKSAHSVLLFSATLSPGVYYRDLLGLPEDARFTTLPSPFSAEQLQVQFTPGISTRKVHRQASLQPIAELIAKQYRERPGHYLAFFSSFKYAKEVSDTLAEQAPDIPQRSQKPGMSPEQRRQFLAEFQKPEGSVAFAVLGGVFSEGIDLPGDQLIGAFVATLGLPPFDAWHEILKERLQQRFGEGYNYTYLIPGLQKVAQAAGRVIRTPDDRGVIWLIDDRFLQPGVNRLLPRWWFSDSH